MNITYNINSKSGLKPSNYIISTVLEKAMDWTAFTEYSEHVRFKALLQK